MNSFPELGLIAPLCQAVAAAGYSTPTPIQVQAIPPVLEGRDLLGCARTGTGKTAAFALPILQRLAAVPARGGGRPVRALVLVPTRELAAQVCESFQTYGSRLPLATAVIYGGVGQGPQVNALRRGVDILVATPGRLVDLMGQGLLRLDRIEVLVLDEADHMLDLGFIPDVRRVLAAVPKQRQTLFFSATMPPPIAKLAATILVKPVEVIVTPVASTVDSIDQLVHFVGRGDKARILADLLSQPGVESALVFTRTKRGADRVAKRLSQDGIPAEAIHGNKSQNNRERTLEAFRSGRARVLVATDIAARGIDVDGITHVVNFELPNVPEVYVHRIGRTGRAGASGSAISLCDDEERPLLRDIEKLLRRELPKAGGASPRTGGEREARRTEGSPSARPERAVSRGHGGPAGGRRATTHGGPGSHGGHGGPARVQGQRAPAAAARRQEPEAAFGEGLDHAAAAARPAGGGARGSHAPLERAPLHRATERRDSTSHTAAGAAGERHPAAARPGGHRTGSAHGTENRGQEGRRSGGGRGRGQGGGQGRPGGGRGHRAANRR
ncbi:MAG: DEAD/DEAH box helicase [Planctomycetes bacterium]|nr:DEAD/DEAH box helicase [Planctomycetota bacterium]